MIFNLKLFMSLLVVLSMTAGTLAIRCYQCSSLMNPKCGEQFEEEDSFKYDCSRVAPPRFLQTLFQTRNATGCMKKTMEAVNGHSHILRSCYFGDLMNTQTGCQEDPTTPFVKQLACDVCSDNMCNGAPIQTPIIIGLIGILVTLRCLS